MRLAGSGSGDQNYIALLGDEVAACEVALGNSGTGKTHVALALGVAACQKGFPVAFTTAAALVHQLMKARDEKRL